MTNMQYKNRISEYNEQNTIGSPVAAAVKQFADRFLKRGALRRQGGAFRVLRQGLYHLASAFDQCSSGLLRVFPNVLVCLSQVLFSLWGDDNMIRPRGR